MTIPTYTLADLQQIESEAADHASALLGAPVTITGPGADDERCGFDGTDVGCERPITAHVDTEHIGLSYYSDLAAAYEWEGRGSYSLHLAKEIARLYARHHAAPPAPVADDDAPEAGIAAAALLYTVLQGSM